MSRGVGPLEARAKVNLYLHVTGHRADGFNELDSLFVRVSAADRLWLAHADTDSLGLELTGPFGAALAEENTRDNLVMRAVDAVRRATGHEGGFCLRLEKNLPLASGLGGGSADAAAALKGAATLIGKAHDLPSLARTLGADVLPCLHETPILVSGVGEIVRSAPGLPAAALILVNPGTPLATPKVFGARQGAFTSARPLNRPLKGFADLVDALSRRRNDLEEPACRLDPAIARVLAILREQQGVGLARMSGSGATCFGLTEGLADAQEVAAGVRQREPDWWVTAAEILCDPPASPLPIDPTSR